MKLLIVDDEELTRTGVISSLDWSSLGIDEVIQADDGVHGLETARLYKPEIILCDVRMPRMDGDEATREIRALDRPDAATLPIIAETADAFEEGQRRARDAGMTALTTKPLNIHELMALLAEHIPEK